MSRFSRDFLGGFAMLAEFQKYGVKLADTKTGLLDLDSQVGQFQAFMGLSFGSQETKRLGERSKRGLKGKVLQKFSSGGRPPFGYARDPVFSTTQVDVDGRPKRDGVRFVPHPTQAPIIKRIFERYCDGESKHAIATLLNREGVPSAAAGGTRNGRPNSGTWSTASIKGILENELYAGLRVWNRTSRKGEKSPNSGKKEQQANPESEWVSVSDFVPALIDEPTWSMVQQRLKADGDAYKRNQNANGTRQYLLSGMIRCACSGASFSIGVHRGIPPVPHYRCTFHARGSSVCPNPVVVSQVALEAKLKALLEVIVKDPKQLQILVAEHNRRISSTNEEQLAVVRTLEGPQRTRAEEVERLVGAVAAGQGKAKALVDAIEKDGARA
jgi:site-specific DNA recombinase